MGWTYDVEVTTDVERGQPMSTTGGHVWDAAKEMATFLEQMEIALDLRRPGIRILELGAGCGWLGLTVGRNLPEAHICMTEMEEGGALEHLEYNLEMNKGKIPVSNVSTAPLDWSMWADDKTDSASRAGVKIDDWDLIIGSDLVYNEIGVSWLPKVIHGLVGASATAYYSHTKHRLDMADQDFFANIASMGLSCKEVRPPGVPTPPPSPPFFESLFPEQRIAIFEMRKGSEMEEYVREKYVAPPET